MDRKLPLNTKELLEKNYNLIMDKCKEMMDDYKDSIDKMSKEFEGENYEEKC